MRRADDIAQDEIDIGDNQVPLEKCAHLCRKTYTNTCAAFSYNFKLGECSLKTRAMRSYTTQWWKQQFFFEKESSVLQNDTPKCAKFRV